MKIEKWLRAVVLTELLFPLVLLTLGIYHGLMQMLYRAGIVRATGYFGIDYYQGLTLHGIINAIVLTTFFAIAFGNVIVSQFLRLPLSRLWTQMAMALMLLGTFLIAWKVLSGQASVLYTFYPPLKAHPIFYIGLVLFVVGSWVGFWVWIPPYLKWRREKPTLKTPLAVVGILSTFSVWQLATLPVAYEVIVQLIPWSFGWVEGVNITLARTLFWFFGHPLVYFWLIPTYIMYYTILPAIIGGKLFSDFAGRFVFLVFIVISCPLGLHHQYADPGIGSGYKFLHAILTSLVSIPSLMTAFTIAASMEYAAKRLGGTGLFAWWEKLPYFDRERWLFPYLFCGLVIFIFGGFTGIVNASYNVNLQVHNTAWIPAHFHMTVGGPIFLGILGMSLMLITGLTGKRLADARAAMLVPYFWLLGIVISSGAAFFGGLIGIPRRTNIGLTYLNPESPIYRPDFALDNLLGAVGGSIMTFAVVMYFYVLARSLLQPTQANEQERFALPVSEVLHDENVTAVKNLKPWVIAGIVLIIAAYAPPLAQIISNDYKGAPRYLPENPTAVEKAEP